MNKNLKVVAIVAITALVLILPLGAQTSNLRSATAGVYGTDVDNFMSVRDYTSMNLGNWFGMLGTNTSGYVDIGYATNALPVYLGAYYRGNILSFEKEYTKTLDTDWDLDEKGWDEWVEKTETEQYTNYNYNYYNNNVSVLVGAIGMGFKANLSQSQTVYNSPIPHDRRSGETSTVTNFDGTEVTTTNAQKEYDRRSGTLTPSIEWGMRLPLGEMTLAPRAIVSFGFYENKFIDTWRAQVTEKTASQIITYTDTLNYYGNNNGYMNLGVTVGANLDMNSAMRVGLDYSLGLRIYANKYDVGGHSGTAKGTVSWTGGTNSQVTTENFNYTQTVDTATLTITESTYMQHTITPLFRYRVTLSENVKLGTLIQLPITIRTSSGDPHTVTYTTTEIIYKDAYQSVLDYTTEREVYTNTGNFSKDTYFSVAPSIGVGVTGAATERFTISGGFFVNPFSFNTTLTKETSQGGYTITKEKTTYHNNDRVDETYTVDNPATRTITDTNIISSAWNGFSGSVRAGFGFKFTDSAELDFLATAYNNFNIDWLRVHVLLTLKFNGINGVKETNNENN